LFSAAPANGSAWDLKKNPVVRYRDALRGILEGKMKLFRRHLLGRRLDHSGRGVIAPCPELAIDRVRLPVSMLRGILTPETAARLKKAGLPANASAAEFNDILNGSPVWVILIRQPSLHRHNFTAFRVSCWERDVIGIPPFVTPGYNADFDGDSMAVFLPPEPHASDLSHMTLLNNPGLVGTGKLALASGLDLALGWMNIYKRGNQKAKKTEYKNWLEKAGIGAKNDFFSLECLLEGLFKKYAGDRDALRDTLLELQKAICRGSTGAATMTPVDFENLYREMKTYREAETSPFDEKKTEKKLDDWIEDDRNDASNLARFVRCKVKGGAKELRVMTAFVGRQSYYEGEDTRDEKDMTERMIEKSFWEGLSDEDMFLYSYASRSSMASKKLDVAKAGYLSTLLAEGLYESTIVRERCSSKEGMEVYWEDEILYLAFDGEEPVRFPLSGEANRKNLKEALGRIAWGRERLDAPGELLNSEAIEKIAESWLKKKKGGLRLRSPLTCDAGERGVCAACAGADPASRPYDRPVLMTRGSRVGLTAAQAIGERGTQLAMKRFHDTSSAGNKMPGKDKRKKGGKAAAKTSIEVLKSLLIQGRDDEGEGFGENAKESTAMKRFRLLVEKLLTESGKTAAFKELPQQLIHFELALKAPHGLGAWSSEASGRWLAALAYGGAKVLEEDEGSGDEAWGLKSRLMWDRE
jgi:hypothetical protein